MNEHSMDKVFWDAEAKLIKLAKMCGNALKILVIYDICREPIAITKENVRQFYDAQAKSIASKIQIPSLKSNQVVLSQAQQNI